MAQTTEEVFLVPEGKIRDFIDSKLRKLTPEEYVRQNIERALVLEYKYVRDRIEVEFSIKLGSKRKKVDLAVFLEGKEHKQEFIYIIVETKPAGTSANDKNEGVEQLKSYIAACMNCKYGMWTNGEERYCFEKEETVFEYKFKDIIDIPPFGISLEVWERPAVQQLKPATGDNLLFAFKRCHNYIHGNQGLSKQAAFFELLKVIFCKIEDERSGKVNFYVTSQELNSMNGWLKVKSRIGRIFDEVRNKYPTIFKSTDSIDLDPKVLTYIMSQFQGYYLLETDVDVKGKAYEEIVGPNLRGDRGEFFTPRNICRMAVEMLDPEPEHITIDPACGTGGFLILAMNHVLRKIEEKEKRRWRDPWNPTDAEREELWRKRREYMDAKVFGMDINPDLVRACKMNMVMNNDGSGNLYPADSLANPATWSEDLRKRLSLGAADILMTNPPFGSKIPVDPIHFDQYDIARRWEKVSEGRWLTGRGLRGGNVPPEQLFLERCVQFIKPGTGRMAIVLPDSILSNPDLEFMRFWILKNTQVLASIDMPQETFEPWTGTQTSVLFLRRKSPEEIKTEELTGKMQDYNVFMAIVEKVGHDRRGNVIYRRDPEGNKIMVEQDMSVRQVDDRGLVTVRKERLQQKIVDDQLPLISQAYLGWLKERSHERHAISA